jgi:hypothetical protein
MYSSSLASASPASSTRHVISEEDGHRVVVGLGKEFAWRRSDNVRVSSNVPSFSLSTRVPLTSSVPSQTSTASAESGKPTTSARVR